MHHKNRINSIFLMGGFLALSLAACDGKPPDVYPTTTTTATTGTTGTTGTMATTTTAIVRPTTTTTTIVRPTTTTARPTTTTTSSTTTTTRSTTTTTIRPRDAWSFVGVNNNMAWTVLKNNVPQGPATPQFTPVTVRVGDTVEWRTAPGAFPHGLVFSTQAAAEGMFTFVPGVQTLQGSACVPGFTWGTNMCGGFPAGTNLARATVKATGSLRFTCEVHGPANMTVTLNATP